MGVAPFTGAWIEMARITGVDLARGSLPSRERGLKSAMGPEYDQIIESLPSRERGLKCRTGRTPPGR